MQKYLLWEVEWVTLMCICYKVIITRALCTKEAPTPGHARCSSPSEQYDATVLEQQLGEKVQLGRNWRGEKGRRMKKSMASEE